MVGLSDLRGLFQHAQFLDWVVLEAPDSIPGQHGPAPGAVTSGETGAAVPRSSLCCNEITAWELSKCCLPGEHPGSGGCAGSSDTAVELYL